MKIFAIPFNAKHINPAFIKAFHNMSRILANHNVHLIIIDSRVDSKEHLSKKVESILAWVDGLIFTGSPYNIDPKIYGETHLHTKRIDPEPRNFEFIKLMIETAELKKIPMLGICAGAWHLNVVRGGTIRHDMAHLASTHIKDPRDGRVAHPIDIVPNTVLFGIFKSEHARVNSWHDKAVGVLGKGLRISAQSPDGVIEAIEANDDSFYLGVQFHPEYLLNGDVTDDFLSASDIAKQQGIFSEMVTAAHHLSGCRSLSTGESEIKAKALAYHEANTEKLIHVVEHYGKLQLR